MEKCVRERFFSPFFLFFFPDPQSPKSRERGWNTGSIAGNARQVSVQFVKKLQAKVTSHQKPVWASIWFYTPVCVY